MIKKINCPLCGEQTTWQDNPHRPFCSERCQLIDLGQWADESYRIQGSSQEQLFEDREIEESSDKTEH